MIQRSACAVSRMKAPVWRAKPTRIDDCCRMSIVATMLILQQSSILVGFARQTGAFIRDTAQADLWIMDPQVRFSQDQVPVRDTVVQPRAGSPASSGRCRSIRDSCAARCPTARASR